MGASEYTKRAEHRALVEILLGSMAGRDVAAVLACLHDDVYFEVPFDPFLGPLDKSGVEWLTAGTFRLFKSLVLGSIRIHELVDPDRLVVEYTSECRSVHGDVPYENRYISIFEFADGQVIRWLEFTSPLKWQEAKAQIDAVKAASPEANP